MQSNELDQLATALAAAQAEFGAISKDSVNPYFSSRYASLSQIQKETIPVLSKHGLSISQFPVYNAVDGDGLLTYLLHSSGQWICNEMRLHLVKNDPQAQGSATSYAKRYAWQAAVGVTADEDDDGNKASGPPEKPALGAHRRSAPKADAPTAAASTTTSSAVRSAAVGAPENRVGAADAKRELIADALDKGWDEVMARNLAKQAWGDRGSEPVERGELLLLLMQTERADDGKS